MSAPTFPLGLLLWGVPSVNRLRVKLFKGPAGIDVGLHSVDDLQDVDTPGVTPSGYDEWEDAKMDDQGNVSRRSKSLTFRCTGANPGCQALGYYVELYDGTTRQLLDIRKFDTPRPMAAIGDEVELKVTASAYLNPTS